MEAQQNGSNELLTVDDVAIRLRVKTSWVYSHADELGAFRVGKYLRFSWSRVVEHLEHGKASLRYEPNDPT